MPEQISASKIVPVEAGTGREWYAIYTMSRHEKRVATHCERIGIEPFLPLYGSRRNWKNRTTVDLQIPLFPNYLFVHLATADYGPLLRIPGLLSVVGNAAGPAAIPEGEIEALRRLVRGNKVEPHSSIAIGDRVRIQVGPLEGIAGVVERKGNSLRLVVTLDLIGRGLSVEIEANALALVAPAASSIAHRKAAVA